MVARYAAPLVASAALASGAMAAIPVASIVSVAGGATAVRGTSSGTRPLKIAISKVIFAFRDIVGFARRHPKFKTIAVLVVVANEIRGLVMVVVYLKTFGLDLPT